MHCFALLYTASLQLAGLFHVTQPLGWRNVCVQSLHLLWRLHLGKGWYRSWKTWKVLEFYCGIFQDSGKSWEKAAGSGKFWKSVKHWNVVRKLQRIEIVILGVKRLMLILESWKFVSEKGYDHCWGICINSVHGLHRDQGYLSCAEALSRRGHLLLWVGLTWP